MIEALTHISHGSKNKEEKSIWISATKDFSIAEAFLKGEKVGKAKGYYNAIAVIELNDTIFGEIYDSNLLKTGYINKRISKSNTIPLWGKNKDNIVVSFDMGSDFTRQYLASYFFFIKNIGRLNFRSFNYAKSHQEVLLLGEDIKFSVISSEEEYKKYRIKEVEQMDGNDHYKGLYDSIYKLYEVATIPYEEQSSLSEQNIHERIIESVRGWEEQVKIVYYPGESKKSTYLYDWLFEGVVNTYLYAMNYLLLKENINYQNFKDILLIHNEFANGKNQIIMKEKHLFDKFSEYFYEGGGPEYKGCPQTLLDMCSGEVELAKMIYRRYKQSRRIISQGKSKFEGIDLDGLL